MSNSEIIKAIATVIASGTVASVVSYWLTARGKKREFLRERAETVFTDFRAICQYFQRMHFLLGIQYGIDPVAATDSFRDFVEQGPFDRKLLTTVELNIILYFPNTLPHFQAFEGIINSVLNEIRNWINCGSGNGQEALRKTLVDMLAKITPVQRLFEATLIGESKRMLGV